ncbi:hypothetical protein BJX70DRAFT_31078 [Aspergillus crustosus]
MLANDPQNTYSLASAPLIQCLKVHDLESSWTPKMKRYSIAIGDGINWVHCLLLRSFNHLVQTKKLSRGNICRLHQLNSHFIKGKLIFVIHKIEVLEEFGICHTIGDPCRIEVTDLHLARGHAFDFRRGYSLSYYLPISQFPLEIFGMVVSYLDQADKLALSRTSKRLAALVGTSLYSEIQLRTQDSLVSFEKLIMSQPDVCRHVRAYMLKGHICHAHEQDLNMALNLERFPLLREFHFRPHTVLEAFPGLSPLLQRAVTDRWMQGGNLRRLHVYLNYHTDPSIEADKRTMDNLLQAAIPFFTAPALEKLGLIYRPLHRSEDHLNSRFEVQPCGEQPEFDTTTTFAFTNLQALEFQWNGLPLPWLSALLRLPRELQTLSLYLSLRYSHIETGSPMTLDTVLAPVSGSLVSLEIVTGEENDDERPEHVGLRFGTRGLSHFRNLRKLDLPGTFLTSEHGFMGRGTWFPPSLITLSVTDGTVRDCHADETAGVESIPDTETVLKLDTRTEELVAEISGMLSSVPDLARFAICSENHDHVTGATLLVGKDAQPLVDRGVRFILQRAGLAELELEVKVLVADADAKDGECI